MIYLINNGVCLRIISFSSVFLIHKNDLKDTSTFCLYHGTVFVEQYCKSHYF